MDSNDTLKLTRAISALRRVHIRSLKLSELDHREFHLLRTVAASTDSKGVTIGELSEIYNVSKPAISNLIKKTEQKGFVERQTDKADRRVVWVKITPDGLRELEKMRLRWEELGRNVEAKFGEENLEIFLELTDRLTEVVNEVLNEELSKMKNTESDK